MKRKILIGILVVIILFSGWWIWKSQIPPTLPSFESLKVCENDFDCQCCDIIGIHKGHPSYGTFEKIYTNVCINKNHLDKLHRAECRNIKDEDIFCEVHRCKCKNNECIAEFVIEEK